jgi:hypothetical protein
MGFEKILIFAWNPWVLAYGFTKNYQFCAKNDRNSVFLGRDPGIANRLSITVPNFNFYGFWKISYFCSKSKIVSQRFYRKLPVWGQKLTETPYFLVVTPVLWIGYLYRSRISIFTGFEKFHIFARNPMVLAYSFTENYQFGTKTDRNSIFLGRDPRIANQSSITVPYFSFYGFWKISHFCSKSKGVAYGFTDNCEFGAKTDRNSVFLSRDPYIANRLSITVPYFNFYGFWKKSHFCSKSMSVSLRFYWKLPVWGKNWPKLRISWSWPPYCESVIYNGPVFQFLRVLKNFTFFLEIQMC